MTRAQTVPLVVLALVFSAVVPWRSDTYFEGQLDIVVVLKAVLTGLAVLIAVIAAGLRRRRPTPAFPVLLLGTYLAVTAFGALLGSARAASLVIDVRLALIATAVVLVVAAYGVHDTTASLMRLFGVIVVVASLTGVPKLIATGRLAGGAPPLNPNELALIASVYLLWRLRPVLRGVERLRDYAVVIGLFGVVFLTGSRTTLLALVAACAVMLVRSPRVSVRTIVMALLAVPVVVGAALYGGVFSTLLERGGREGVVTLANRTIAWSSAFSRDLDPRRMLFGDGLAVKKIPVAGQWWDTQILDSSWVSAYVQGGALALGILGVWALAVLFMSVMCRCRWVGFWSAVSVLVISRSFLESGMLDASVSFVVFLLVSLAVVRPRYRIEGDDEPCRPVPGPAYLTRSRSDAVPAVN